MNFGYIKKVLLFGGGNLLNHCFYLFSNKNYKVFIVTAERCLEEKINEYQSQRDYFIENEIEYIETDNLKDNRVSDLIDTDTLGISFGAPWVFDAEFISKFNNFKLLNCHSTRLPQDRGAGGFSWRILNDERLGACLLHIVDTGIDTGGIIKYKEYVFPNACRKPNDFFKYSFKMNCQFFTEFIEEVSQNKNFEIISQQETFSTYFPRLNTETHGFINWDWKAEEIERFICAFDDPYAGVSTYINNKRVYLKDGYYITSERRFHPFINGILSRIMRPEMTSICSASAGAPIRSEVYAA